MQVDKYDVYVIALMHFYCMDLYFGVRIDIFGFIYMRIYIYMYGVCSY